MLRIKKEFLNPWILGKSQGIEKESKKTRGSFCKVGVSANQRPGFRDDVRVGGSYGERKEEGLKKQPHKMTDLTTKKGRN